MMEDERKAKGVVWYYDCMMLHMTELREARCYDNDDEEGMRCINGCKKTACVFKQKETTCMFSTCLIGFL